MYFGFSSAADAAAAGYDREGWEFVHGLAQRLRTGPFATEQPASIRDAIHRCRPGRSAWAEPNKLAVDRAFETLCKYLEGTPDEPPVADMAHLFQYPDAPKGSAAFGVHFRLSPWP